MNSENTNLPSTEDVNDVSSAPVSSEDKGEGHLKSANEHVQRTLSTDKDDDYDLIDSVRSQPEDEDEPYSKWTTLPRTQTPSPASQICGLDRCFKRRILIAGTVVFIVLLAGGLVSTTSLLMIERNHRLTALRHMIRPSQLPPNKTAAFGTSVSNESSSQAVTSPTTSNETDVVNSTDTVSPSVTTEDVTTFETTLEITTSPSTSSPSSRTTTTTTTTTTPSITSLTAEGNTTVTTDSPCIDVRKCHSCTSFSSRCPKNGTMGDTEQFGQTEICGCSIACFSEVKNGDVVHRGCVQGKGSVWEDKSKDLNCQQIGTSFVCFCLGNKCNGHDMTMI